jgi:hypothetical protein
MTIHVLAPTSLSVVEQTPEQDPARPDSGDNATHCQCTEPTIQVVSWFGTVECSRCYRAIFRNGKPVRA